MLELIMMPARLYVTSMVSVMDRRTHQITDEARADAGTTGVYRAMCGVEVAAAPLSTPDGPPCRDCVCHVSVLTDRPASVGARPRVLSRFLDALLGPATSHG
jgi:formylmethanofuran:tetrahydromethanopterin formyltransferase